MSVITVFVSGRSGSGKTTAINYIKHLAWKNGCNAVHMKDYPILYEMFQADLRQEGKRFKRAAYEGFEILDYTAFDEALIKLEGQIKKQIQLYEALEKDCLVVVEFARSDYRNALRNFTPDFLQNSYFFYVEAEVETCIRRIHERVTHRLPGTAPGDHHFVPDTILQTYFNNQDDWDYMAHEFKEDFDVLKEVVAYRNSGSQEDLLEAVNTFMETIFSREFISSEPDAQPQPAGILG